VAEIFGRLLETYGRRVGDPSIAAIFWKFGEFFRLPRIRDSLAPLRATCSRTGRRFSGSRTTRTERSTHHMLQRISSLTRRPRERGHGAVEAFDERLMLCIEQFDGELSGSQRINCPPATRTE
jgi:hypothetical protein